jgi:fucose permease
MPIVTFPANFLIEKYGMSSSTKVGLVLTIIGAWIRVYVNDYLPVIIIGNLFAAIGAPLIYNGKTKLSAFWFYPE